MTVVSDPPAKAVEKHDERRTPFDRAKSASFRAILTQCPSVAEFLPISCLDLHSLGRCDIKAKRLEIIASVHRDFASIAESFAMR